MPLLLVLDDPFAAGAAAVDDCDEDPLALGHDASAISRRIATADRASDVPRSEGSPVSGALGVSSH